MRHAANPRLTISTSAFLVFLLASIACNLTPPPVATTEPPPAPVTDTAAPPPPTEAPVSPPPGGPTVSSAVGPMAYFSVAVIVDTTSEPVSREQAQSVINEASAIFAALTPFGFEMIDFVEDGSGDPTDAIARRYIEGHAASLPNGIVIFSFGDNGTAKLYGGYAYSLPGPAGFRNVFVSPVVGENQVYVAVINFGHKYARCGYGDAETVQSPVSIDGECRNTPGVACVEYHGYSMCADAVDNLYASTPTYFTATNVIHEFLHSFGPAGNYDHYASPECNARMGWPEGYFDLFQAEYYNGLCPDVYQNFIVSYRP